MNKLYIEVVTMGDVLRAFTSPEMFYKSNRHLSKDEWLAFCDTLKDIDESLITPNNYMPTHGFDETHIQKLFPMFTFNFEISFVNTLCYIHKATCRPDRYLGTYQKLAGFLKNDILGEAIS